MTYHEDEDIYKKRGKTRQNLKVRDKRKKVAKDYVLETKPSRNYTYNSTTANQNAYENALGPKPRSRQKNYLDKARKPVVDKPRNVKQAIPRRQRSESPPAKHLRSRNGRNKGKADCCSFCRPEISKRMYDAFSTKMTIKNEVDRYQQEQEELERDALINEASAYDNYSDLMKSKCRCKKGEEDDEGHGTESPGQDGFSSGAQDENEVGNVSEGESESEVESDSESEMDEEYGDYHRISRSDEGIKEMETAAEGWELVDGEV